MYFSKVTDFDIKKYYVRNYTYENIIKLHMNDRQCNEFWPFLEFNGLKNNGLVSIGLHFSDCLLIVCLQIIE